MVPEWFINLSTGAVSAFFGACLGSVFGQRKDRKDSYRRLLEPYIIKLGDHCYQSIAIANTLNERIKKGQNRASWLAKHRNNRVELEHIRLAVRYTLWGCDEGLRCLIRLPTWINLCYKDQQTCAKLIEQGNILRQYIDKVAFNSLETGTSPSSYSIYKINKHAKIMNKIYNDHMRKKTSAQHLE